MSLKTRLLEGYEEMHVPSGHHLPDATGVAFASAWARPRCLQLYLLFIIITAEHTNSGKDGIVSLTMNNHNDQKTESITIMGMHISYKTIKTGGKY